MIVEKLCECMCDNHWWDIDQRVERSDEQVSRRSIQRRPRFDVSNPTSQTRQDPADVVLTGGISCSLPQEDVFVPAQAQQMCERDDGLRLSRDEREQRSEPVGWGVELRHAWHACNLIALGGARVRIDRRFG